MGQNAAGNGHLEVMRWARENGCPTHGGEVCARAAKNGHLHILLDLQASGVMFNCTASLAAAQGGQLEVLRWLRAIGCPWDVGKIYAAAVERGHVGIVALIRANQYSSSIPLRVDPWNPTLTAHAAEHGKLAVLQWLRAHECPWR